MAKKIKSIEIEAFRGYDSTQLFSLATANGRLANLNVLYAPNGFGKTSFIDAIEWALTGQITRFQNNVIRDTADRHAGNILRNYDSNQAVGKVHITFEDGLSITRLTKNNRRNRQWDVNDGNLTDDAGLLRSNTKGGHRIVDTLTQESTDQSVCFTTPEQRFDALKPLWDSNDDTYIYKSLLGMSKIARDQKKELENDISNLTSEILISFKNQGLSTLLNQQLGLLNEVSSYQVEEFPDDIDPSLLNRRLELLIRLKNNTLLEISSIKETLNTLANLQSRFESYNSNILALKSLNNELASLNSAISDAKKLTSSLALLQELTEKRTSEIIRINKANNLDNVISDFIYVIESINIDEKNILTLEKQIQSNLEKANAYKEAAAEKKLAISTLNTKIENIRNDINLLRENYNKFILTSNEIKILNEDLTSAQNQIDLNKLSLADTSSLLNKLKSYLNISKDFFTENDALESAEIDLQFKQVKQKLEVLEQKEKALKSVEENYNKLKSLNETLIDIINRGKYFIRETRTSACPLCATDFGSIEQIMAQIDKKDNNSDETVDLDYYKADIVTAETAYQNSAQLFVKQLKAVIKKQDSLLLKARNLTSATEDGFFLLKNRLSNADLEFKRLEAFFAIQLQHINDKSISDIIHSSENNLELFKKDILSLLGEANNNEEILNSIRNEINLLVAAKNKYEADSSSKRNLPVYNYGFELLKEINLNLEDITTLNTLLEKYRATIAELTNRIDEEELSISNYFEVTQGKSSEEINSDIAILRSNIAHIKSQIDLYIFDWKKIIDGKELVYKLTELSKKSNEFSQKLITLNTADSRLNDLISFVESLKKGIELNFQLAGKQAQLAKVNSALNELEVAKQKSILYIERKIAQEFNEKLINDIYKKVEPHPTLKEIKFVPELDGDKAKLDILVKHNLQTGSNKAPVVYFSSAQINILSLSIFLAKSLQNESKVVNTIFMDDPIQFLDSINTLSFIDLIRVITSEKGLNQQVFISTHDESFFKLLKRKMDPEYYASNFIELETFGIIKQS